jgi:apolipoprotein N-acyltransferase
MKKKLVMVSESMLFIWQRAMTEPAGRLISALLLGSLAVFGFAPYDFPPATLLALVGLWLLLAGAAGWRQGLREGFAFGFGLFGFGISWMGVSLGLYGGVPMGFTWLVVLAFALFLALFVAVVGALAVVGRKLVSPFFWAVLWLPTLWVISEWLRVVIWAGFPWLLVGYAYTDSWLAGWAPIAGSLGVSFAVAMSAGLLVWMIQSKKWLLGALVYGIFWGLSGQLGQVTWVSPKSGPIAVGLVHGQIPETIKWDSRTLEYMLQAYQLASFPLLSQTKLIVWPETAIPTFLDSVMDDLHPIITKAHAADTTVITGVALREDSIAGRQYFNSIASLDGSLRYDKRHLVPFSEFYPGFSVLAAIAKWINMPMAQFSVGETPKVQPIGDSQVGLGVCYEADFGYEMASVSADTDWWLIVSDDGWFHPSAMAGQHWQMTRLRARELGREIVRVTNQGYTGVAHTDGTGTIAASPDDDLAGHIVKVQAYSGTTPYVRWHDMPLLAVLSFILALVLTRWRARTLKTG